MVGFWRTLYGIIGLDYIGKKEQQIIERQRNFKYLLLKEIRSQKVILKSNKKFNYDDANYKKLLDSVIFPKKKKKRVYRKRIIPQTLSS